METNLSSIYTMTVLHEAEYKNSDLRKRCVGFFHELEMALKSVENNSLDMREESYPLAVVEKRSIGPYCMGNEKDEIYWFRWNKNTEKYEKCETPKGYENVISFGMG